MSVKRRIKGAKKLLTTTPRDPKCPTCGQGVAAVADKNNGPPYGYKIGDLICWNGHAFSAVAIPPTE